MAQADKSASNSAYQVIARSPFRSFDRVANACCGGSTISPAAPVETHYPHRAQIPIETVAPPAPNFPRFRASALLGRLPLQRVDRPVIQASEKPAQLQTFASGWHAFENYSASNLDRAFLTCSQLVATHRRWNERGDQRPLVVGRNADLSGAPFHHQCRTKLGTGAESGSQ